MTENRKGFTFIWKIEKVNSLTRLFCSPRFIVSALGGNEYQLFLHINTVLLKDKVFCNIRSPFDTLPCPFQLDYELAFFSGDGTLLQSKMFLQKVITNRISEGCQFSSKLLLRKDDVSFFQKDRYISNNSFTVRCRMWKSKESFSYVERCVVETRTEVNSLTLTGTIEKFSYKESGTKHPVNIKLFSTHFPFINISFAADGLLYIEIIHSVSFYVREIFILDKYNQKVKFSRGKCEVSAFESVNIPLVFSKEYLVRNKEYFLPNDELTIYCKNFFPGQLMDEIEYIFDCEDTRENTNDVPSEKNHVESLTTLTNDWISMFMEGILCDVKLKTTTEIFPVHTVVLSARSPVFKSMFTNDMREKMHHCVDINDLDADTVRRMLLFMYSDNLDDLEYESAKSLYFAANKYNIVSLRQRCSNFLKQNIMLSNCLDILLLADKHQDKDLKYVVQSYIAENDEAVLFSDEWRNLEENKSRLTVEIFRFIYMKNRRN